MNKTIELLAPGGDIDSIKAAIAAGADAVYCGLDRFNARNRAENISFDDLQGILRLAHKNNCEVFLTLNIIIVESEIPALIALLNRLVNTSIDGIIVQDLGVFYLVSKYFKRLNIHASTQLTTHNEGQIKFLSKLSATRVNLSRELNIDEIKALTTIASQSNILTEVFVHGSYCLSFSGICYMSSLHGGNSGNRGRCSQPCRDQYETTPAGKSFPLNLKDNSAFFDLKELVEAGVASLKIEGRIKKFHYVFTAVNTWKRQIQSFYKHNKLLDENNDLYKVFNRDFTNSFLKGDINKDMFIDNPRDHSAIHLSKTYAGSEDENLENAKRELYDEKTEIIKHVKSEIEKLSIERESLIINVSGRYNAPLKVIIKAQGISFIVHSEVNLENVGAETLSREMVLKRFKVLNETEYYIKQLDLDLSGDLFIPYKELTAIKNKILFHLNGSKEMIEAIDVPVLKKQKSVISKPDLSVLISSKEDVDLCNESSATIYFQLPSSFKNEKAEFIDLFSRNKKLIPWFPSILIGEDYKVAVEFLHATQANCIVTNNTGIAYEAWKNGIPWIAGPYLNIVNSYSLLSLKENFNCIGSFISNEISQIQIKAIKKPEDFKLFYSIYHPIVLMTSRQCLFHQVTGCEKNIMDDTCIQNCERSSSITNLKKNSFIIEKSKGNYHTVYNEVNYLNTDVITDIPSLFDDYFIDLSEIKTETKAEEDKLRLIKLFENLLNKNPNSKKELDDVIHPTTNTQYRKGI